MEALSPRTPSRHRLDSRFRPWPADLPRRPTRTVETPIDIRGAAALPLLVSRNLGGAAPAPSLAAPGRVRAPLVRARDRLGVLRLRDGDRAGRPEPRRVPVAPDRERRDLRRRRPHRARDPALAEREPQARPVRPDREGHEAGDRRDRGQALLPARGDRPDRPRARRRRRPADGADAGRLDDHPAVREERLHQGAAHAAAQARRGRARGPGREELEQGPHPHRVPEHRVLREPRLRRRGGRTDLLRHPRALAAAVAGGAARRHRAGAHRLRPGSAPQGRARSPQRGARQHAPAEDAEAGRLRARRREATAAVRAQGARCRPRAVASPRTSRSTSSAS